MTRRRGKDSGRTKPGSGQRAGKAQRGKGARDERPDKEKPRQGEPGANDRNDTKAH
jgi:hypothetical protein